VILIPAIDLKEGKCVRLRQGRMDDATVFSDDPVAMAVHWREQGARRLHIVDLDGAFAGEPRNRELIQNMVAAMGEVPVQVGGGIRTREVIDAYIEAGVAGVIVGTKAIQEPQFLADVAQAYPQQVWFGCRSGVHGHRPRRHDERTQR
jgi:phosphoribosylformimino-5-aminoimidazole carboxamide ribotide isomerase